MVVVAKIVVAVGVEVLVVTTVVQQISGDG